MVISRNRQFCSSSADGLDFPPRRDFEGKLQSVTHECDCQRLLQSGAGGRVPLTSFSGPCVQHVWVVEIVNIAGALASCNCAFDPPVRASTGVGELSMTESVRGSKTWEYGCTRCLGSLVDFLQRWCMKQPDLGVSRAMMQSFECQWLPWPPRI